MIKGSQYINQGLHEAFGLELKKSQFKRGGLFLSLWGCLVGVVCSFIFYELKIRRCCNLYSLSFKSDCWYVIYTEWSNRTKHVLKLLDGCRSTVVFVGKCATDPGIKDLLEKLNEESVDTSGWNVVNAGGAGNVSYIEMFALYRYVVVGLIQDCISEGRVLAGTKSYIGLQLRMILALKYLDWSMDCDLPKTAFFGHTGVADTGALDYAIRSASGETTHYFHGISHGHNFWALSSHAYCVCKYDVETTKQLGGYKSASYLPHKMPAVCLGSRGWLLITNYAHPSSDIYQEYGIEAELSLLARAKEAFELSDSRRGQLFWQPHPAFKMLKKSDQDRLLKIAKKLDIRLSRNNKYQDYQFVLTTPSTVIIDLLKLGILPCLDDFYSTPQFHIATQYPEELKIKTSSQIVVVADKLADDDLVAVLFPKAWDVIGPGCNPSLEHLTKISQ